MEEKQISPVENFDWEAYEKGEVVGEKSREELVATYDQSLNTVKDKEVIEERLFLSTNVKLLSTSVTNPMALFR